MPSDRLILLMLLVAFSVYAAFRYPSVREPLIVGSAVGAFLAVVMFGI
ncbi:hypothetical protein HET69_41090 [Streptomyces sp. CJ_13]|nr:hypothetical protein [Streptomyces sp. CJ_13]MBT1190201.1 hypothetical protein [Streptomyces sp. CJ_13]